MIDNGHLVDYPVQTDPIIVKATVTDASNNTSPEGEDEAVIVDDVPTIPEYIPTLDAQGTIITGAQGDLNVVIRIGEFNDGTNFEGDLRFTVIKNTNLVLNFNPTETTRQAKDMENSLWEFSETNSFYIFTYKANGRIFPAGTVSRIGLSGTFTSPSSAKGQFALDVTIVGGTGEENLGNNKDTDVLEYNNLSSN